MVALLRRLIGVIFWPVLIALLWTQRRTLTEAGRQLVQLAFGAAPAEEMASDGFGRPGTGMGLSAAAPAPTPPPAPNAPAAPSAPPRPASAEAPAEAAPDAGDESTPPTASDETLVVQRELAERAPAGAGRMPDTAPVGDDDGTSAAPEGAVPGDGSRECPSEFPIKGNASSRIYHSPGQASYANTIAEFCFATAEVAEAAGYRPPRR